MKVFIKDMNDLLKWIKYMRFFARPEITACSFVRLGREVADDVLFEIECIACTVKPRPVIRLWDF